MSNFRKGPPTISQITCKTCGVLKPRTEFPVVDGGRRIDCNCTKCSEGIAKSTLARVDVPSLSYSSGLKLLMEGKFK